MCFDFNENVEREREKKEELTRKLLTGLNVHSHSIKYKAHMDINRHLALHSPDIGKIIDCSPVDWAFA